MKQDGVWGGQPELQALSEMYRRPIEIYTDSTSPENLLGREFNHLPNRPPIRLRYLRSHYNSISSAYQFAFVENETDAGTIENMRIQTSQMLRESGKQEFESEKKFKQDEDKALEKAIEESLNIEAQRVQARITFRNEIYQALKLSRRRLKKRCGRTSY